MSRIGKADRPEVASKQRQNVLAIVFMMSDEELEMMYITK